MNNPAGIALRCHPVDGKECKHPMVFIPGDIVLCDRKIKSSSGVTFYHVVDADGWVFDMRCNHVMMRLMSSNEFVLADQVNDTNDRS